MKREIATFFQKHLVNQRVMRHAGDPGQGAIIETTGRRSGLPRRVPVLAGLVGDTLWVVAHHGRSSAWVRNLEADPRVRVRVGGGWRGGRATTMPDDDPLERVGAIDPSLARAARRMGTTPMTVRIDLDAAAEAASSIRPH